MSSAFKAFCGRVRAGEARPHVGEPDLVGRAGQCRVSVLRAAARADAGLPGERAAHGPPVQRRWGLSTLSMFVLPPALRIDITRRAPTEALLGAHRVIRRQWETKARRACGFSAGVGVLLAMSLCAAACCLNGTTGHLAAIAATFGALLVALSASGIAVALSCAIERTDRRLLEEVEPIVQRRVYRICGLNPIARRYVDDVIAQGRLLTRLEVATLFWWWSHRHVKWRREIGVHREVRLSGLVTRSARAENAHLVRTYR